MLGELDVAILEKPFGVSEFTTPFPDDREHATPDAEAVTRFGACSTGAGACSTSSAAGTAASKPVHLFWHGLDLAVTRFSGRPASPMPDADPVHAGRTPTR
jgi:hypothetical protein